MKQCPRCNQTYSDDQLNFCLNDGELLTGFATDPSPNRYTDDSPPTVLLNDVRRTNPSNWSGVPSSPSQWQQQGMQNVPFATPTFNHSRDKTLPTIALVLGMLSIPMMCCYGGIWLGIPAAVVGFLGMRNVDKDPSRYTGRGMAIGGMVVGIISFILSIVFGLIAIIAS